MKDENTQREEKDTVFRSYRERIYFRQLFHSMLLCIILFFFQLNGEDDSFFSCYSFSLFTYTQNTEHTYPRSS